MPFGESYDANQDKLQFVYFPTTSVVSLLHGSKNGYTAEFASVGNEGMLGMSMLMEGNDIPSQGFVRTAGFGYRLKAQLLMDAFNRSGAIRHLLVCYAQALITQITQTRLCGKYHSLDQQLCRCLLLTLDSTSSKDLILTQELVAGMIGVSTESIMHECDKLQQVGILASDTVALQYWISRVSKNMLANATL
ncbi:MAG: Crp/Fnr family transcriptional regulator [Nitrosomonadales bacterium]